MAIRWNAKADSVSTMVLWMGSLIAAIICIAWLAKNLSPDHITLQQVDNELTTLQRDLATACKVDTYWKNYNPGIAQGNLIINNLQVCIDSSQCRVAFYMSNNSETVGRDGNIIVKDAYPCMNIEKCSSLYYDTGTPEFINNSMVISGATICENKVLPITRCRLLMCSLNTSMNLNINEVIYLNITKDEGGRFTIEKH